MFSRLIMGKDLDEENTQAFLESVYETGNYRMATIRTDLRGDETCLELTLYPETLNKILLRAGFDYEGTFSSYSFDRAALRSGLEFQHKDGLSLLLRTSILDELSIGISVFRPLGPYFFLSAEADLVREQKLMIKGILNREEMDPDRYLYFHGTLKGGLRFNRYNSLSLWPEYFWFREDEKDYTTAGIGAAYVFSNLDYSLFPSRGFRGKIENHFRLVPESIPQAPELFDLLSVDLTAAIPLGSRFSLGFSGFASSLFAAPELPPKFSAFEDEKAGRIYFPHASGIFIGEKRAALSLFLQFEPRKSLSMLGGRLIFSLAAAVGRAGDYKWNDWGNFTKDDLIWNTSLGVALVPLKYFGLQIRTGAGGAGSKVDGGHRPAAFVSLDIGMSGLQKRLFQ